MERVELPVFLNGSLIDLETTKVDDGEIICYGCISEAELIQVCAENQYELREVTRLSYQAVRKLRRPLMAFNKSFEEAYLGLEVDIELNRFKFEKKWKQIPYVQGVPDPFKGEGGEVARTCRIVTGKH